MIRGMGIIRPQTNDDGAGRWAIALDVNAEQPLVGTRTGVLDATRQLTDAEIPHHVLRRPGSTAAWQLVSHYPPDIV